MKQYIFYFPSEREVVNRTTVSTLIKGEIRFIGVWYKGLSVGVVSRSTKRKVIGD